MADVKIAPLSHQGEQQGAKLPIGTYSAPAIAPLHKTSPQPRKRGCSSLCRCFLEVQPHTSKWLYFVGFVISAIISWILRDYSDKIFKDIKGLDECLGITDDKFFSGVGACVGKGAVLRISFGTFLFFALHFMLLAGVTRRSNKRRLFHTGCWPVQLAVWVALVVACFFMPNNVYSGYGQFAKVAAGAFLVLVVILFVDWFYMINEWLLERSDRWPARLVLVFGSAFCYIGSLIALGFMYSAYAPKAACAANITYITLTIAGMVVYTAISLSPWRPQSAGLFTSGTIFLYCTYLCWGALSSQPPGDCVPANATSLPIQIVGFIIAIGSVLYAAWDTVHQERAFIQRDVERLEEPARQDVLPHHPAWFHATLALASCYVAMTLTNWNLSDGPNPWSIDKGSFASWVRIASQWLCMAFYIWTLLAPRVLRQRVFD